MSKDKREVSLDQIKNNKQVKVILISFKAGSTGKQDHLPRYCAIARRDLFAVS